jgi:acyl-CoA hydrolase
MNGPTAETTAFIRHLGRRDLVLTSAGHCQPQFFLANLAQGETSADTRLMNALTLCSNPWMEKRFRQFSMNRADSPGRHYSYGFGPLDHETRRAGLTELATTDAPTLADFFGTGRPFSVLCLGAASVDSLGNINLGPFVDISLDLLAKAQEIGARVLVEVNRKLPRSSGESVFRRELVDEIFESSWEPPEYQSPPRDAVDEEICRLAGTLIGDGATLAVGVGNLVEGTLLGLMNKKNLGVYTECYSNAMARLQEAGAINNRRKGFMEEGSVAAYCLGDKGLSRFIDGRSDIHLTSGSFIVEPHNIRRNRSVTAISQVAQADLSGQVAFTGPGSTHCWGMGLMSVIHRAACASGGGRSIVLLRSAPTGAAMSNIEAGLFAGHRGVLSPSEVDYLVTEHGIADLRGGGDRDRALNIIAVAHPDHRSRLLAQAEEAGIV